MIFFHLSYLNSFNKLIISIYIQIINSVKEKVLFVHNHFRTTSSKLNLLYSQQKHIKTEYILTKLPLEFVLSC
jgi:hypothetical protein